jgi:cell division protein FtsB
MTEEQLKTIRNFEVRMRQLLFLCDRLKAENADLKSQLAAQKNSNDSLRENNIQLNLKYDNLKMARLISVSRDDFKATQNRLSGLVREVDKCIALLNE